MQAVLFWLLPYLIPFVLIAISWNRWSFLCLASAVILLMTILWIDHSSVPFEQQNISHVLGSTILYMAIGGTVSGIIGRGIMLAAGWKYSSIAGISVIILAFISVPAAYPTMLAYQRWERRPPTAECNDRAAFAVKVASEQLSMPNWPLVMLSAGKTVFSLSIPANLRRLCDETSDDAPLVVDSTTFFFDHVARTQPSMKEWVERECLATAGLAALFVCGERPVEQLSIYADAPFEKRTIAYGRVSSHAFLAEQQASGRYLPTDARKHGEALEFPDGKWAFDDGSVFTCRPQSKGYPRCNGDFQLAPGVLAKAEFNAWDGDIQSAQKKARQAVMRLYAELQKPVTR